MDDSNESENAGLSQLHRLNDLRTIAFAQFARVTSRKPDQESRRRGAIVKEIDDAKNRLQSLPIEGVPAVLDAEIDATQKKDDAAADLAQRRSMAEWIGYEREQKAREATRSHQSAQPETSSAEPNIVALFNRILEKKDIGTETWLRDHPNIKRTTFFDWLAAALGKPVKGKVSAAKAQEFTAAILRDAVELGLISDRAADSPALPVNTRFVRFVKTDGGAAYYEHHPRATNYSAIRTRADPIRSAVGQIAAGGTDREGRVHKRATKQTNRHERQRRGGSKGASTLTEKCGLTCKWDPTVLENTFPISISLSTVRSGLWSVLSCISTPNNAGKKSVGSG